MKHWRYVVILFAFPFTLVWANCDLTHFRWDCEIPPHIRPHSHASSLVYCGNVQLYLNPVQYQQLIRYQRADMNMVLTINDDYVTSPCIPHRLYGSD